MQPRLTLIGALVMGIALLASSCRGWTTDHPPIHLNPNMDTQRKHKAYRATDFFADGRSMRMPIEGTIARSVSGTDDVDDQEIRADAHFFEGQVAGAVAASFPSRFAGSAADMKRGQERYNVFCAPCHGVDGAGAGTVARRLAVKPPTFHEERLWNLLPGDVFQTITHGKNMPNMPAYAAQIPVADRWAIVFYLRALMKTHKRDLPLLPSSPASDDATAP